MPYKKKAPARKKGLPETVMATKEIVDQSFDEIDSENLAVQRAEIKDIIYRGVDLRDELVKEVERYDKSRKSLIDNENKVRDLLRDLNQSLDDRDVNSILRSLKKWEEEAGDWEDE